MKNMRGFTLIELLVVIAIIGILSAVALASLSSARTKGFDAAIKSSLDSLRSQIEIDLESYGGRYQSEGGFDHAKCPANTSACGTSWIFCQPKELKILANIADKSGKTVSSDGKLFSSHCAANSDAYMIEVPLRSGGWFCMDSGGDAVTLSNNHNDGSLATTCR